MSPLLQVYKKYLLSNAVLRSIPPKFQSKGLHTQWVISTRTLVEKVNDDEVVVPVKLSYTKFTDLIKYMDHKDQSISGFVCLKVYACTNFLFFQSLSLQFLLLKIDILAVVISAMDQKQVNRDGKESIVQKFVLVNEEYELLLLIIISYIELLQFLL